METRDLGQQPQEPAAAPAQAGDQAARAPLARVCRPQPAQRTDMLISVARVLTPSSANSLVSSG